jgi:hypothetical protein
MPTIVACKLPHGLTVNHMGRTINLNGANANHDPLAPAANGTLAEGSIMSAGFGLTTLNDADADAFNDWANRATYKDGLKANGPLDDQFPPLVNGTLCIFKSEAEARKETNAVSSTVSNGMDGLDGDAEIKKAAAGSPDLVNTGKDS